MRQSRIKIVDCTYSLCLWRKVFACSKHGVRFHITRLLVCSPLHNCLLSLVSLCCGRGIALSAPCLSRCSLSTAAMLQGTLLLPPSSSSRHFLHPESCPPSLNTERYFQSRSNLFPCLLTTILKGQNTQVEKNPSNIQLLSCFLKWHCQVAYKTKMLFPS